MKRKGRSTDQALLRTALNKKVQTFSHKRLMKDLQEIENQTIPTVGVVARPLDHDLFTWHGNIRGPEGTLYEGGIFHIELKFPQSYPNHPPTVTLFNTIPHPNVFGNFICLDMIQGYGKVRNEEGGGWSSAYSVQSVLTQLQSFLFEENLNKDKKTVEMEAKKAVKEANSYKCNTLNCKHGGKLSAWPQFSVKEQKTQEFKLFDEENDLIRKELVCFHTKLGFKQNQLGLGLKISKIPRTGNIRQGQTYFDYLSIKAFLKQSMKFTANNERITHWIPVYFGKQDNQQRFLHFLQRSLSMIMTNSTKNFKPEFIIEVFPKLMITTIYYIMDEKKHASIRAIRILSHLHSMFLFALRKHQQMQEVIADEIGKFLENEDNRHKNVVSNLGSILAKVSAIDKFKFDEVAEAYFNEQLDRQVLWILKAVPELLNENMKEDTDKLRSTTVFKTQMTSFHMFCFYKLFLKTVCQRRKSRQQMLDQYESNLCKLSNKQQTQFQKQILEIPKKVTNFKQFFSYVGLKQRNQQQIISLLHQAIKNSQRKKYHGEIEMMYSLPSTGEQLKNVLSKVPSYDRYIKVVVETLNQGDKETYTYKIKQEKSVEDNWKQMCVERWAWVREALSYDGSLNAQNISNKALQYGKEGISKPQDRLAKIIQEQYLNSKINYKQPKVSMPQTSWKKLFLRLDLEDFLSHIDMNPDFKIFYQKLQVCKFSDVNTILIQMIQINNIKSGFFYLTSLLSKLTTLKYIQFTGLPNLNNILSQKAAKAIKKGFSNFRQAHGKLEIIAFHNISVSKDLSDCLFNYLATAESITSLRFSKTNIFAYGNTMKVLANYLVNLKNVEELVFDVCSLDQEKCKILADSLMRMKHLKIFEIHDVSNLGMGLASIIYNLTFSPNLSKLDISRCQLINTNEVVQTVVSLQKLLKINSSIELIKATNIYNLNPQLSKDFWVALGQCRTLRVLDLAFSGDLSQKKVEMGQSIAFNAKKKGSLEYLNIKGSFSGNFNVNQLYNAMNISQYDEEALYGDPNKLAKMIASNYKKAYFNNLKALQFDNCSSLNPSNFTLAHYNKLVEKKDPEYVKLFAQSPCLESIHLRSTNLAKNIAEVLVLALDPRRANFVSKIKVLDLSKNMLGKEGIKILAQVLPHNNILEVLDLSKNSLGVSGACQLSVALKNNKSLKYLNLFNNRIAYDGARAVAQNIVANSPSLEFLQIGHNRIRDKGLKSIIDAIVSNKQTALKILCFRFNFVTNSAAEYLIQQVSSKPNKLEEIFMRNNSLDDVGINNLYSLHQSLKAKVSIDLLQKIKYLEQDKSDRTIWIHPIASINLQKLKKFFEIEHKCGIVLDLRVRKGRMYPGKNQANLFGFVEFADETSVTRALHLAAKKSTQIDGVKFRVYKAGTGTFLYTKKTAKQRKIEVAAQSLPTVPYAINAALQSRAPMAMRGRGRGGRGRGGPRRPVARG